MRIPSGVTDQFIYFVAVDATDHITREPGLSSFNVYRSRNGAAAAAMTTPTINETDNTNMPGVYELLLDEDMTIGEGNDSEEMVFHITHAGMAPVTRTIELYRPKITPGHTLGVAADGDVSGNVDGNVASVAGAVGSVTGNVGGNVVGSVASVTGNVGGNVVGSVASVSGAVGSVTGNVGGNVVGTIGGLVQAALNAIADGVWDENILDGHGAAGVAGLLLSQLAGRSVTFSSAVAAGSILDHLADDGTASFDRTTDSLQALRDGAATVGDVADGVWDEAQSGHVSAGTFGEIASEIATILTTIGTVDGKVDTIDNIVDAIKTVTDQLVAAQSEPTGIPAADATPLIKLGILYMMARNKVTVTRFKKTYFGDDDAAEFEKDLSDDDTTYTESEVNAI